MPKTTSKPKKPLKKATPSAKKSSAKKAPAKKPVAKKTPPKNKKQTKKPAVKKAPVKKAPVKKVPPVKKLPKSFLNAQLKKLEEERAKYITSAEQLEEEAEDLLNDRTTTDIQVAEESGEGDTTSYYRELDLTISAQSREVVEQIDAAIVRIKKGTYGICIDTGRPIPKKRLEAIPWASKTVEAKAGGLRRQ